MAIPAPLQRVLSPLSDATWTLAALSSATECGLVAALAEPRSSVELSAITGVPAASLEALVEVLVETGLASRQHATVVPSQGLATLARDPEAFVVWRDDLRRGLGQPRALVEDARQGKLGTAWHHVDEDVIEAQGTFARVHTRLLMVDGIVPELEGLAERLAQPGARVLDVGAGAAGNAIGFAEAWPVAHVVGLEPWAPSLARGVRNVAAAGLEARITLRADRVEELDEPERYDAIWLPQMFLDEPTLERALDRCRAALRHEGWLMSAWICDPDRPGLASAIARLRDIAFGGAARGPRALSSLFAARGLVDVRSKAFGDGSVGMIAARAPRPPQTRGARP